MNASTLIHSEYFSLSGNYPVGAVAYGMTRSEGSTI